MGENAEWPQVPGGVIFPNGLLPNAGPVIQMLDSGKWLKAEEKTGELIECIKPNSPSEERRNAVAHYVQQLIMKCFPCQVFTFGSVPLKTYLPDGDIDLTAFSNSQTLKDTWANQVREILENEEKNENAEFRVKEVQYIQAEVKLIKCLVENIVVDISFNQLGGLCTLCFLEEVDHLISQNHLFKRSIILIKAWCYYESRVLGAHHGLISTYALETLVLYIFHVFNNSFTGPLEVLYRFLEFFSNFDWDNFCVSLWGPVPITSLPNIIAEPPRKDHGELLLKQMFLEACSSVYAVHPGSQENQGLQFVSKHFNVIDPLRINNNLGRSVSKGNFYRIRSAFAFGAKKLARLLDCPEENLVYEVNQFFTNTWERHGSGNRPDAPPLDISHSRLSTPDHSHRSEILKNGSSTKKPGNNLSDCDPEVNRTHLHKFPAKIDPTVTRSQKGYSTLKSSRVFDQAIRESNPKMYLEKVPKTVKPENLANFPGKFLFARTRSSPELTDASVGFSPQGTRNKAFESAKNQGTYTRTENLDNYGARSSAHDHLPISHAPRHQSLETVESNSGVPKDALMDEEEQDLVNMMANNTLHGLNGQIHMPLNLAPGHLPFPISPSILASMGYNHRNFPGMIQPNIHFIDPSLAQMQFPQGLIPPSLAQYYPGIELNSSSEDIIEQENGNFVLSDINLEEGDRDLWQEQDVVSDNRNYEMLQSDDKPQPSSLGNKFVPSYWGGGSASSPINQQKFNKENRGAMREVLPYQDYGKDYLDDNVSCLRSRTSSESSWDGTSAKVSRTAKEKMVKNVSVDDDEVWDMHSSMGNDMAERSSPLQSIGSLQSQMSRVTSGSESVMPMGPVFLGHGSRQGATDNPGVVFYPTGPPVPFLTMLPVNYIPPETGNAESSTSMDNSDPRQHFEEQNTYNDKKPDILNSDFASHWQNLLFGRYCQNPIPQGGPVVPPMYLQGRVPFDGTGRPQSANNMNLFTQLMGYGQHLVPVAPFQSGSSRPPAGYQHYVEEIPRQRSGTGTYLPIPQKVSPRERNSSGTKRVNSYYDRNESHADVDRSWTSPKSRGAGRNHTRGQNEKLNSRADRFNSNETRADRPWNSYRRDSFSSYQGQNSHSRSNSSQSVTPTPHMAYNMYPVQGMHINGVSSNGPNVPVMFYPVERNDNYDEQVEFRSLGQMGLSSSNEQRQVNEGSRPRGGFDEQRFHGASGQRSSPDQPSSPHFQRGG